MKNLKHYATASIGLILFASVIALSLSQSGNASLAALDKDVRVINTQTEAVPVQGVGNFSAQQSGVWNVGITGTPPVRVTNGETNPVVVRVVNPVIQEEPFQFEVTVTLTDGQGGQNAEIPVPVGKLFTVENVSAFGTTPSDQRVEQFALLTHIAPDNILRPHYLQFTKQDNGFGTSQYTVSQQVKVYADTPGVLARVTRTPAVGTVNFRFVVSGCLTDK